MLKLDAKTSATPPPRAVATGLGIFTPLGSDCQAMCAAHLEGKDSITQIQGLDLINFTSNLASTFPSELCVEGLSLDEMSWMDRATLLTIKALREALCNANTDLSAYNPDRIAVVLGSSHSGLLRTEEVVVDVLNGAMSKWKVSDLRKIAASLVSNCTAVIARTVGAKGRVITISSACASSNSAIGIAADLIRSDEADLVITGGSDTVSLSVLAGFNALRALCPTKNAPFSPVIGLNIGEGAGIVILERHDMADNRGKQSRFEVLGYGLSGDAHHGTAPDIEGKGAESAMLRALEHSGISAESVDYVNAHGTGTESNDSAEAAAYRRLFGERTPISSLKSFYGHTLGASGVIELISSILVAETGHAPQGLRQESIRTGCSGIDFVSNTPRPANIDTILVNSYGFGGNNSALCISQSLKKHEPAALRNNEVVIVGSGMLTVAGADSASVYEAALNSASFATEDSESGIMFNQVAKPRFTEPHLKPFARTSPSTRFSIATLNDAIGGDLSLYENQALSGLLTGMVFSAQKPFEKFMESVFYGDPSLANAHNFPMTTLNATGGQCSIAFQIKGFTTTLCGSASALCYGLDLVRSGRQERMAVTAADEATPRLLQVYDMCRMLDKASFGEGGVAISLESRELAYKRGASILGQITGWAHRQDPVDIGPRSHGHAVTRAINAALKQARLQPSKISKRLTVSTGSRAISLAVLRGARRVFGKSLPSLLPLESTIGMMPAAGTLAHVAIASELAKKLPDAGPILVYGADILGDCFAFIVEADL